MSAIGIRATELVTESLRKELADFRTRTSWRIRITRALAQVDSAATVRDSGSISMGVAYYE